MSHYFYLAPEVLLPFSPLTSKEFELIRRKARELWQDETRWSASSVTTYAGSYRGKQPDEAACHRLAQRAGQQQFEYKPTPLPSRSAYGALPGQAGSQEPADCKGGLPGVPRPSQNTTLHVKHKVAHQIWGSEAPCLSLPDYRTLCKCMKPPKPGFELLMNYRTRGKNLLKQLQRQQWDYESEIGSSEDSQMDRYSSDYSAGSSLILN
ncbi:uncharacterized protein C4orf51 homolog [Chionomys nivalis]|uniref:uncharacterized protein C4orf51 homolog n=1 Tax=Chionomys nivalis TaxID=269649 RepID=UPI0025925A9E|nr:uncharacterized protein C4orf51 homolog [Chionomys nivalis]